MGHMGFIDYYRLPLASWYWYRKELLGIDPPKKPGSGTPGMLALTADRETIKSDGTQDVHIKVMVQDLQGNRVMESPDILLEVVSGGGIFPTGRSFWLSRERGNLTEGLGAIELRSYYAGDVVIRASSKGLACAELTIHVTGQEAWENQELCLLQPPPYVTGMPERDSLSDIGINRPVFCSSASDEHPARNVVDGTYESFWKANSESSGEWIVVDLEGTKEIMEICVVFKEVINEIYEIALSDNRKDYRTIYVSGDTDYNSFVTVPLAQTKARYVRIYFPGKSEAVAKVAVNAY